jgi:WD40 repeat protein
MSPGPFAAYEALNMKLAMLVLLAAVTLGTSSGRLNAQPVSKTGAAAAKPVSLIWFPRFSPDGKWLLSAHGHWDPRQGGEVRMWEAATGKPKHVIAQPRGVRSVCWAPDNSYFVMGGYAGDLRVFDSITGKQLHEENLGTNIEGVAITYDQKRLVATLGSGSIKVFELPGYQEVQTIKSGHNGGVWGMCLSPDGNMVASCGRDTYVRVHNLSNYKKVFEFKHPGETNGVVFTPDNKRVLTGCTDGLIRVFDIETGKQVGELRGHEGGAVTDLQFTSDGKRLASSGVDDTVRLWSTADLTKPKLEQTFDDHESRAFGAAFSPDGSLLASVDWAEKIVVWDLKKGAERWSWTR